MFGSARLVGQKDFATCANVSKTCNVGRNVVLVWSGVNSPNSLQLSDSSKRQTVDREIEHVLSNALHCQHNITTGTRHAHVPTHICTRTDKVRKRAHRKLVLLPQHKCMTLRWWKCAARNCVHYVPAGFLLAQACSRPLHPQCRTIPRTELRLCVSIILQCNQSNTEIE